WWSIPDQFTIARLDALEVRRPGLPRDLERVQARDRKLIRNTPPSERWSVVLQSLVAIDVVESVEAALRPVLLQTGHDRHRPIAMTRERGHQSVALLRHQQHVRILVSGFDT